MAVIRILVVEDDPSIQRLVRLQLEEEGFDVVGARSGEEALKWAELEPPDAVLLDLSLPGIDGYEVMRSLLERWSTPIILMTGRGRDAEKVQGLERGADDYVTKPFNPEEVAARLRAVLRRPQRAEEPERPLLRWSDLEVDRERRIVTRGGKHVALTRTEWDLLDVMAESPGRVIPRRELLTKVRGAEYREEFKSLRVWISRLRAKLEQDPLDPETLIRTFPGVGYMLVRPDDDGRVCVEDDGRPDVGRDRHSSSVDRVTTSP